MSHGVEVERLSPGFRAIAHTAGCAYAAIENAERKLYGVQFHPEFKSRPNKAHPLFLGFVGASLHKREKNA